MFLLLTAWLNSSNSFVYLGFMYSNASGPLNIVKTIPMMPAMIIKMM